MRNVSLASFLIFVSVVCSAQRSENFFITAQVHSFDTNFVNLQISPGRKIIIPRIGIEAGYKLQANQEWQRIPVKTKIRNQIKVIQIPLLSAENSRNIISGNHLLASMKKELARAKLANY